MPAIGITGHRILAEVGRIEAGLDDVVQRLDHAFPEPWSIVTSLAEGADRLATRHLLERAGSRIIAVLPVARADYEADFESVSSKREFRTMLARAAEVVQVAPGSSRDEAYEAAGLAMLERSDVLVAVWDGEGAQGQGGTGGIVAEARRRDLPIAWVHAGNRLAGTTEPTSLGVRQGSVTYERFPRPDTT